MKVKVIKVDDSGDNWYKIGEVIDVKPYFVSKHGINYYPCEDSEHDVYGVDVEHCEVIREESLQSVEDNIEQKSIDKHYNFNYDLSAEDRKKSSIKVDPYFVANVWKLGEKDNTGVLFHCLKTIARFSEKNSKEREIKALYKQIKRLAELENIDLES